MSQGKSLTEKETMTYQNMYLETLMLLNGLYTLVEQQLKTDHLDLGIANWAYYRRKWLAEDEGFKLRFDTICNNVVHMVENEMFRKIREGDTSMIRFFLERKGDYVEKKENKVDINQPVKINIIRPDNE